MSKPTMTDLQDTANNVAVSLIKLKAALSAAKGERHEDTICEAYVAALAALEVLERLIYELE